MSSSDDNGIDVVGARGGVQSVEIGMRVLRVLADAGGQQNLTRIAELAEMAPPKAHRYLVSLMRSGFVERATSNQYSLGPEALRIGLIALARTDVIEVGGTQLQLLKEKIPGALLLAVWGATGPTIVRWFESNRPVTVNVRAGSNMPLLRSATGQVFAAYLPWQTVEPFIRQELDDLKKRRLPVPSAKQIETRLQQIRKTGLGHTAGEMLPGVLALAAPVFNHQKDLAGVIAALGPSGHFDDSLDGATASELKAAANAISLRLGAMTKV